MDGRSRRRHATISGVDELLHTAAAMAVAYAEGVDERERVSPGVDAIAALEGFDEELPDDGTAAADTLRLLDGVGGPASMATTGARYFGFVNGAVLPVALGAAWIASAWDQNAALPVMSPVAVHAARGGLAMAGRCAPPPRRHRGGVRERRHRRQRLVPRRRP